MAKTKIKVTAEAFTTLDDADYENQWAEEWADNKNDEDEELPEMPPGYALDKFREALEEGDVSLDEVMEDASISVELA